jgi:hypothetical protein
MAESTSPVPNAAVPTTSLLAIGHANIHAAKQQTPVVTFNISALIFLRHRSVGSEGNLVNETL